MSIRLLAAAICIFAMPFMLWASPSEPTGEPDGRTEFVADEAVAVILQCDSAAKVKLAQLARYVRLGDDIHDVEARLAYPNPSVNRRPVKSTDGSVMCIPSGLLVCVRHGKATSIEIRTIGNPIVTLAEEKKQP